MATDSRNRRTAPHVDRDGVRTTETAGVRTSVWLLVLAMLLVGIAVFVVVRPTLQRPEDVSAAAHAPAVPTQSLMPHRTPVAKGSAQAPPRPAPGTLTVPGRPEVGSVPEPEPPAS